VDAGGDRCHGRSEVSGCSARLREPEYLAINPAGTLPALIDGDRAIYESLAICEYLAAGMVPTWS